MRLRKIGVGGLVAAGVLLWICGLFGLWAKQQALDTEKWVETSTELLEDERVRDALGVLIVDRLFASADVQDRLESALPPQLDGLAGPTTAALRDVARRNAPRVLGNDAALGAWRKANEIAHGRLTDIVAGRVADSGVVLDLRTLIGQVAENTGLPAGQLAQKLPPEVATLVILRSGELDSAEELLDRFKTLVWLLLGLAVAAFAAAITLTPDRRRTVVAVGGGLMFAALAVLAIREVAGVALVDELAETPNAQTVAGEVWSIATSLLVEVAQGSFLLGGFVATGAWLGGGGSRATSARRATADVFRDVPALPRTALAIALLLLVLWGPVPWTQRPWPMIVFSVAAFAWLEWIRRGATEEFPARQS